MWPSKTLYSTPNSLALTLTPKRGKKTAAYKMLNQTPLGVMLEEVAAQLLDKGMGFLPNRKLSGTEAVTLAKHAARHGWVFGFNASLKGHNALQFTLVLRELAAKRCGSCPAGCWA